MIHIFYRHYPVRDREDWRPEWFDYEKCFKNLIHSIFNKDNVTLNVIYDGEKDDNFIFNYDVNFFYINVKNDYDSFKKTIDIIKNSNIDDNDLIYLLENDYLHVSEWDCKVIDFFNEKDNDYLSLYDHNDKYFVDYSDLKSKIIVTKSRHFRTTPSTCGSFITTKKVLIDDYYAHYNSPTITKTFTNMPVDHAKFLLLKQLKNRNVYTPIPGLSTHCLNGLLSPTIEWSKIINE
jgi:hypothetical protein